MSNLILKTGKVKVGRHTLFRKTTEGATFVVNLKTGLYYTMNETGANIWAAIKKGKTVHQIAADMVKHFRMDRKKAEREVAGYLEKLGKEKLITFSHR